MLENGILLNRFFTPASVDRLTQKKDFSLFDQILSAMPEQIGSTNSESISNIYKVLAKQHRNEYFYKNTLLNNILLGRHSLNTSVALRELPVADSILDFLIINGVGQVYEIKTELDNLKRLPFQLNDYYRAFKYVNIVTDVHHLDAVLKLLNDSPAGVILLTARNTLRVIRQPRPFSEKLSHEVIFKILRKPEYEEVLIHHFGHLPITNQFKYFQECLNLFKKIPIEQCHMAMLKLLKKRNLTVNHSTSFSQVPKPLKEAVYFYNYREYEYENLFNFLNFKTDMR